MGSGFVPSGILGDSLLERLAAILSECVAYSNFVGATVAGLGVTGMYFHGIDRHDLAANNETFPGAFVIWDTGDDFRLVSTQGGGTEYKPLGSFTLVLEGDTPSEFRKNTPGAYNWIKGHANAVVAEMRLQFGEHLGRINISRIEVADRPYRERKSGEYDYCCICLAFHLPG